MSSLPFNHGIAVLDVCARGERPKTPIAIRRYHSDRFIVTDNKSNNIGLAGRGQRGGGGDGGDFIRVVEEQLSVLADVVDAGAAHLVNVVLDLLGDGGAGLEGDDGVVRFIFFSSYGWCERRPIDGAGQ